MFITIASKQHFRPVEFIIFETVKQCLLKIINIGIKQASIYNMLYSI